MNAASGVRRLVDETRVLPTAGGARRRAWRMVERNVLEYRRMWLVFATGFAEPLLYLLSIGVGVGALVGTLTGPGGRAVSYQEFVAPGLLAASTMNGAVYDTTFGFFIKYKYAHTYDAVLATPLGIADVARGEALWALMRVTIYAAAFVAAMGVLGLLASPWAVLALPAAALIGLAFGAAGLASTTWMRSWTDFDYVNAALVPMFLFSATFFPLDRYPGALRLVVQATPLYQGVALERALVLGHPGWADAGHVLYLLVVAVGGLAIATRRLQRLLQP